MEKKLLFSPPEDTMVLFNLTEQQLYKTTIFRLAATPGNLRYKFFFARGLLSKYCSSLVILILSLPILFQEKNNVLAKASKFLYYSNVNASAQ